MKTPTKLVEEFNEHNNETKANPTIRTTPCNDEQEMVECHPDAEIGEDEAAEFIGQRSVNAYADQTEVYEL